MSEPEKKSLEAAVKEKVAPLVEETMEKSWGITIPQIESDIADKLKNPLLQLYIPRNLNFPQAKKLFKTEFLKQELIQHLGNVSQVAKSLGIDRRSIHRAIKEFDLEPKEFRKINRQREVQTLQKIKLGFEMQGSIEEKADVPLAEQGQEEMIGKTIRSALEEYKQFIQPQQLEKFYAEVPRLSRNIAEFLPHQDLSWKEAEREFEQQFLSRSLKEFAGDVVKTAKKLKIRPETLYRKIKKWGLR